MKHFAEVEIREARAGREPTLHATIITEGRAASERRELFTLGALEWPSAGIGIMTSHRGAIETRGQPVRQADGRITLTARATPAIREAVNQGRTRMSIEFRSAQEGRTRGGIREVTRAFVDAAAMVPADGAEYTQTAAELRSRERWGWTWL